MSVEVPDGDAEAGGALVDGYGKREERAATDFDYAAFWEERKRKARELVDSGWGYHRAMEGWGKVGSREEWEQTLAVAGSDLHRGRFLIETLGAERYLEPEVVAVLLTLRRSWIEEYGAGTAPELMLVDSAVMAFWNQMRAQRLLGNLFTSVEREFFARESPSAALEGYYGKEAIRYRVEDLARKLSEDLQPLLDRANRMLIRNLKALRELRAANVTVNVNAPSQLNLAERQVNVAGGPPAGER